MCALPVQASLIGRALGQYQVEALIGRGAMGTVYLAKDLRLNRLVALKVLLGSYAQSSKLVKQFHAEAHAAAPLRHENVVRIYTAGTEDNIPYIAMEFVDGEPLDRFLRRKGKVNWQAALYMAGQVALALDCAHEHGVIHRDVKPSNIMLDRKGRIRLTDFGIARMQMGDQSASGSRFMGTPQYMSPEQCTGRNAGPQSDLFSLGVCLYQMISGRMPFEGESSMALIKAICTEEPPRLNKLDPEIPDDVSRIVAYLMEKEPDMRPASARTAYALMRRTRKQVGGQSSVADSITEFLKTETEVRPFSRVYEERQSGLKRRSTVRRRVPSAWIRPAVRAAMVAGCAIAAFAAPLALAARDFGTSSSSPVPLRSARFAPGSSNEIVVSTGLPAYRLDTIDWAAGSTAMVVRGEGRFGGLAQGDWGLLLVEPEARRVSSYLAPAAFADSARAVLDAAVFDGGALVAVDDAASGDIVVLKQALNSAVPEPDVVVRVPRTRWWAPGFAEPEERHAGRLAISRDGSRLAMLLWDPVSNGFGIYLQRVDGAGDSPALVRRTSRRGAIVPDSITFSPHGERLGYLRTGADGHRDLWVLSTESRELDGEMVALRVIGSGFSFSSDGAKVAVTTAGRDGDERSLRVFDVVSGQSLLREPNGRVSRSPWLGDSGLLVYTKPDDGGPESLYATRFDGSEKPRPLRTTLLLPEESYSISPDGRWIAFWSDEPALRLVAWNDAFRGRRVAASQ